MQSCFTLSALALLTLSVGATDTPATPVVIQGKVSYKGVPLRGGTVAFHPAKGKPIKVAISEDGGYALKNVPVGEARVTVETDSLKKRVNGPEKDAKIEKVIGVIQKGPGGTLDGYVSTPGPGSQYANYWTAQEVRQADANEKARQQGP
jgi:hypothetical protein